MSVKVNPMTVFNHRSALSLLSVCLLLGAWLRPAGAIEADIRRDATVNTIEKVLPSVVNIATTKIVKVADFYDPIFERFYGRQSEQLNSIGSGIIISEDGYLLTNLHVVQRASRVQVKLWNGEVYDAENCVGTSQKDVALLKIKAPPGKKFQAMKFANDDDLLLGETVLALGNPYGLGGSVSRGILSSKNRRVTVDNTRLELPDWLQTDADINPGNSGGPLVNLRGELIGINVAVYREEQGMGVGFAIPIRQVTAALSEFFTPEAGYSTWFGARLSSFQGPLTIASVQPRSPAEKAGLRAGQRIITVNGTPTVDLISFYRQVTARNESDRKALIQLEDEGERRSVTVSMVPFNDVIREKLGVVLGDLNSQTASELGLASGGALVIQSVEPGSPAARANLRPGFLVTALDDRKTSYFIHGADIISSKSPGERLKIGFYVPPRFGSRNGVYSTTVTLR